MRRHDVVLLLLTRMLHWLVKITKEVIENTARSIEKQSKCEQEMQIKRGSKIVKMNKVNRYITLPSHTFASKRRYLAKCLKFFHGKINSEIVRNFLTINCVSMQSVVKFRLAVDIRRSAQPAVVCTNQLQILLKM